MVTCDTDASSVVLQHLHFAIKAVGGVHPISYQDSFESEGRIGRLLPMHHE
ncbi:hypothetical protein EDF59_1803 [Novosphingobium sp. ST904]|nr:hypothetical protein EDF59_1803 [Novosphingobium sp. ST904]